MSNFVFRNTVCATLYGKCKAEFAAAHLDKYQKYLASAAVLSDKRLRHFRSESHESGPLLTAIMQAKNLEPLLAVSPSVILYPAW